VGIVAYQSALKSAMPRCRRGIIKSYSDKIRGLLIAAFADEDVEIAASLPSSASAPGVAAAVVAHYGPSKDVGISYSDNIGRPNWPGALKQAISGLESIEDTEFKIDNSGAIILDVVRSQAEKDAVVSMLSSRQGIAALDNKDLVVRAFSLPELQMRRSD